MTQDKGIVDKDYRNNSRYSISRELDINEIPGRPETDGSRDIAEKTDGDEFKNFIRRVYGYISY